MTVLCLTLNESEAQLTSGAALARAAHVIRVKSVPEFLLFVRNQTCSVGVISCAAPSNRTDDLLLEIRRADPGLPVIFDCTSATTDDVIRLVRLGAHHVWNNDTDQETAVTD